MTPAAVIVAAAKPTCWIDGGNLFVRYADETVADLGPVAVLPPKVRLLAGMRNLTPEDRQEVMGHFCSECGDEQPDGRRCQCWNDE